MDRLTSPRDLPVTDRNSGSWQGTPEWELGTACSLFGGLQCVAMVNGIKCVELIHPPRASPKYDTCNRKVKWRLEQRTMLISYFTKIYPTYFPRKWNNVDRKQCIVCDSRWVSRKVSACPVVHRCMPVYWLDGWWLKANTSRTASPALRLWHLLWNNVF